MTKVDLRAPTLSDQDWLADLSSRPEVASRIGRLTLSDEPSNDLRVIVHVGARAGVVGMVRSMALDGTGLELICAVDAKHEGQGIATAACEAILNEYLTLRERPRLLASVAPDNPVGARLAKKLGFVDVGVLRPLSGDALFELSGVGVTSRAV